MKLEKVFQIYRKMIKWSTDYCDKVTIIKTYPGDMYEHPTEVYVMFECANPRELTRLELNKFNTYCRYQKLKYTIGKGKILWE